MRRVLAAEWTKLATWRATVWTALLIMPLTVGLAMFVGLTGSVGHAEGEPFPALLGVACCLALTAVLGVAVGVLVRHPAGAITAMIAALMLPGMFAPLFGDFQGWVNGASPQTVLQKMTQTSDVSAANGGSLGAWPSLGIVASYALVLMVVGVYRTARRDA